MLETIVDYNDCNNAPLSNEKFQQAVSKVMEETEEEYWDAEHNSDNVTMDTLYHKSPVTINTQVETANVTNERRIVLDIMADTIKGFNGLTIQ